VTGKLASQERDTVRDLVAGTLAASAWLDDLANRAKAADVISAEKYVNAAAEDIRGRLLGKYDFGPGVGTKDFKGEQMQFFRGGQVSFPRRAHGIWFMSQFVRMGLLKEAPAYSKLVDELILTDLYAEAAAAEKVPVPTDDMAPFEVRLDKTMFDPKKPEAEAARH
jgi:nitrate/nitrite transport system substrate-binding protein